MTPPTQFFNTHDEITSWLEEHHIKHYTIVSSSINSKDFVVDVKDSVCLNFCDLLSLPVQFRRIDGNFECRNNQLTSLLGAPQIIEGHFICSHNDLTDLLHGPREVDGNYLCTYNRLTSLLGAPNVVTGGFGCSHNHLENLKFCPAFVGESFSCRQNQLNTLEHCPAIVSGGLFYCEDNPLLGDAQNIIDHRAILKIHETYKNIQLEKDKLLNTITCNQNNKAQLFKI